MRNSHRALGIMAVLLLVPVAGAAAATLKAPTLNAPGDESTVEASPTLTWNAVKSATTYEFQLSADRQFGSLAHSVKTRNTAATLKGTLIDGTYYWRVRGISVRKKVGRWSSVREFNKRWKTGPTLLRPTTDFGAIWPTSPLVFEWSPVAHATSYIVVVATDPSLAQPVLGTVARPQTTTGTVLAFPGTLNAGTYYWQITPVDADGHKGTPSEVGRFSWSWPSSLTPSVQDLNPAPEVFDPLLTWTPVPGAAKYEVEVNPTPDFSPGSTVFDATVNGTAVSPVDPLPNNTYHWRVRAIDTGGRAGGYSFGLFRKQFDDAKNFSPPQDTVPGIALRDGVTGAQLGVGETTSSPTFTWPAVPGAAEYEVQFAPKDGGSCDWGVGRAGLANAISDGGYTRNPFIDPRGKSSAANPGAGDWPLASRLAYPFQDGKSYCMRMIARDAAGARAGAQERKDSPFTYFGGTAESNTVAFVYTAPAVAADPAVCPDPPLVQPTYLSPARGELLGRTPIYRWSTVPDAKSYYVVVSRNEDFTDIVEVVLTDRPFYMPTVTDHNPGAARDTYEDEQTSYHWAVYPSPRAAGSCAAQRKSIDPPYPSFDKRSVPPALQAPPSGAALTEQPIFSWLSAEGAADYRIQVARDAEFRDLVDDKVTSSTTYAASATYPVDTQMHWRVRARDDNGIELSWSAVRTFRRTLPTPVPDAGNPTAGSNIPELSWNSVPGAVSYGLHVDKVDGGTEDFTVATSRFTPTKFYGNGIWKWKVRANFPASSGVVSGPYTASRDYIRRILPPSNTRAVRTSKRLVFSWNPDASGKKYRLEVAKDDSFTEKIESVTTPNTSYAPLLDRGYEDGGKLYWRVAILDDGNNLGAFARGDLRLPPRLQLKSKTRRLKRGARTSVLITVTDPRGTKIRNATVKFSGAGTKGKRRTGKKGTVTLRLRARRAGTIKITAARKGYVTGSLSLRAY